MLDLALFYWLLAAFVIHAIRIALFQRALLRARPDA